MKKVFLLLGSLLASALVIQQLITGKKKHILSREDDPSIPEISSRVF